MFGRDNVFLMLREGSIRDGLWIPTKFADVISMYLNELFVRCMHTLSIGAMATAANKDETRYNVVRLAFQMRPVGTKASQCTSAGHTKIQTVGRELGHIKVK